MADRFRLIHFKSTDSDTMAPQTSGSPGRGEEDSTRAASLRGPETVEMVSSQIILEQVKTDLKHADPRIRILSLQYLEKTGAPVAIPFLQEGASDPDPEVRSQAVRSLVNLRCPGLSLLLKKCLRDPHPGVRIAALRGIFQSGEGIDLNILIQFLSDESPWVRRKLATLLGWARMEGVFPILTEMSKDRDAKVRKAALLSLITLYPEEGRERLFECYKDEDPDVRDWVMGTLEKWAAPSVGTQKVQDSESGEKR